MRTKSMLAEARQIQLASELVRLGARLQLLEAETDLSRERLLKLYKEIRGVSPPKGMLPYSVDWFLSWQANIHSSLFVDIYLYLVAHTDSRGIDALVKSYKLYLEHVMAGGLDCVLSMTRAWTLMRFMEGRILKAVACVKCGGQFVMHAQDLPANYRCGLCRVPSRAGKSRKPRRAEAIGTPQSLAAPA